MRTLCILFDPVKIYLHFCLENGFDFRIILRSEMLLGLSMLAKEWADLISMGTIKMFIILVLIPIGPELVSS